MNLIEKLRSLADAIVKNENALQTQRDWDTVARLLSRTPVDQARVAAAVKAQDAGELAAIVSGLEHPEPVAAKAGAAVSDEAKHDAMKAFRKRLKLARLADESKLGGRYTSGGKKSGIDAIEPPREFPPEVWRALAAEGLLRDTGGGFYALADVSA